MKAKVIIDSKAIVRQFQNAQLTVGEMKDIEYAGSRVLVNRQREAVPVDTAATKTSIESHITEESAMMIVDEVGPETDYALFLEYGTGKYAESGKGRKGGWFYVDEKGVGHFTFGMRAKPFVRPSVLNGASEVFSVISSAFLDTLRQKWRT